MLKEAIMEDIVYILFPMLISYTICIYINKITMWDMQYLSLLFVVITAILSLTTYYVSTKILR